MGAQRRDYVMAIVQFARFKSDKPAEMIKTAEQAKAIFEKHGAEFLRLSRPTAMLRPVNWANVVVCAHSFANASSFATASCTFPYVSQLE